MYNAGNKIVISQLQMQNKIFQSSAKFIRDKIKHI